MKSLPSRSIRLQSRPSRRLGLPGDVVRRRLLTLLTVLVTVLAAVVVVRLRLLSSQGVGYGLYWLHDHLYLPLIGYGVRLFWPWSLIGWGVAAVFLLVWLAQYLSAPTLLQRPRMALTTHLLARRRYHGLVVRSAAFLARRGFAQNLLLDHLEMMWRIEADQTAIQGDKASPRLLAELAQLYAELHALHAPPHRVIALQLLCSSLVAQRVLTNEPDQAATLLTAALSRQTQTLIEQRRGSYSLSTHVRHTTAGLASEVAARLALDDGQLRATLRLTRDGGAPTVADLKAWLQDRDRERLERRCQIQQSLWRVVREPDQPGYQLDGRDPFSSRESNEMLPILAQLDLDLVFLAALADGRPLVLQTYMEQLDLLRFTLAALPAEVLDPNTLVRLQLSCTQVPRDLDHCLATLWGRRLRRQQPSMSLGRVFDSLQREAQTAADQRLRGDALTLPGSAP